MKVFRSMLTGAGRLGAGRLGAGRLGAGRLGAGLLVLASMGVSPAADPGSGSGITDSAVDQMALIDAVRQQDDLRIAELLSSNVDVNATQPDGATALHWAVHRGDVETIKQLIQSGADVSVKNEFGVMPLSLACTNGDAEATRLLLDAGADVNDRLATGETPLMTAAYTGNLDTVNTLLAHGADVNAHEPVRKQTALMWALGENQTEIVARLIEAGADINATTTLGFNPLLFAARNGDVESTKMLLDAGAYVNSKSKKKLSALHVAAQRGHADVAIELLRRGADPNDAEPGYTALHWACGVWGTELNGANGITAPKNHEWAALPGIPEKKIDLVRALLEAGAEPNVKLKSPPERFGFTASRPPTGSTPYTLAAFAGEAEVMQLLVEYGADPTARLPDGRNALLIAAGVNRSTRELAVPMDRLLAAVRVALKHGADVNGTDRSGNTALHGAAWLRANDIVQYLADQGADVNLKNRARQSPLYIADHTGFVAGVGEKVAERLPVGHLLASLSVPSAVKQSIEKWADLPPHVRKAVRSLLEGELENLPGGKKMASKK